MRVGDVGYMHPDTGTFTTLFNAFTPFHAPSDNSNISIPSILGFGDPVLKHSKIQTVKSRKLFRTFTYKVEVEEGQPMAHCFCESPDWYYVEEVKPPKAWFKASVDSVVKIHGEGHGVGKEDLILGEFWVFLKLEAWVLVLIKVILLVVGTLQASRYSLFVSCNHPTGSVSPHFGCFGTSPFVSESDLSGSTGGVYSTFGKEGEALGKLCGGCAAAIVIVAEICGPYYGESGIRGFWAVKGVVFVGFEVSCERV